MKVKLGANNKLIPLPTTLVGALVNGRPNYITIADIGVTGSGSLIFVTMNKHHYTNSGVIEQGSFSVNVPTVDMVGETDFCGLVSGRNRDKSKLFSTFYGELGTAPMIRECPINMECKLIQNVDLPGFDLFIGSVCDAYCDAEYFSNGRVDFAKVRPIIFLMNDNTYWKLGENFARAWSVGKELKGCN